MRHNPQVLTGDECMADVYARSLLALSLLCDERTGAIVAPPEVDPDCLYSGGYGYCWVRDGTYAAMALARAGLPLLARRFYR